jgi:hypothetical protein
MDLVDALSSTQRASSPVALSEECLVYRRKFHSIYDVLRHSDIREADLRQVLQAYMPQDCQCLAGYQVYVLDTTFFDRAEAKTLEDRRCLRPGLDAAVQFGHTYSWLVRMVEPGTSWVAPVDVERVPSTQTDTWMGCEQVKRLAAQQAGSKAVVADGSYGNLPFLSAMEEVQNMEALVRLRHNRCLYEPPPFEPQMKRGRKRKHGPAFRLSAPSRMADLQAERVLTDGRILRVAAWQHLHLKTRASREGMVLRLELLRPDGRPCYKRPTFVFWTGNPACDILALAQMYLWRFGIEHAFRFFKQQLGLNRCRSTFLPGIKRWIWCCVLAYWQLLLLRHEANLDRPAWYPQRRTAFNGSVTPRLVQRNAARILVEIGSPACSPKRSGKGTGRPQGHHPPSRTRYKTVLTHRQRAELAASSA